MTNTTSIHHERKATQDESVAKTLWVLKARARDESSSIFQAV